MTALAFDPLLGWAPVWAALAVAALAGAVAYWAGLRGWAFRALGAAALALALAGPAVERSTAHALDDIVIVLDDRTASQSLPGREAQTDAAIAALEDQIAALPGTALRRVTLDDAPEGSLLGRAITNAVRAEPDSRLAGVIAVTDGLAADPAAIPADLPAPLHVLLTGAPGEWDRRLIIDEAPAFGLIGQEVTIALRIEDSGAVPDHIAGRPVALQIALDGAPPREVIAVPGARYEVPLTLEQPGANVLMLSVEAGEGELTTLNNTAALSINAVRDRLRVLLVSGEPNPGARSWRNLLKSDPGVDLIHFTILRPMEKADGVPVEEMSLIPFPTHDLFIERIEDFDLIVFDRYRVRGILLPEYFAAIRRYVENGGAVLVSAGPEISTVESLSLTALGDIFPARPTGQVHDGPFLPALTEAGRRHPVTAGLDGAGQGASSGAAADLPPWGRWLQYSEMRAAPDADVVMEAEGDPLLILRRQGEGRVALLASDQVWLWGRGFEGGGPQSELLRRIAHWSMKEPELEEEALTVTPAPPGPDGAQRVTITRRSVETSVPPVTILGPNSGSGAGAALGADGPVDGSATSPRGSAPGEPSGAAETPSGTAAPPDNQAGSTAGTVPGEPSGGTETQSGTTAPSDGQAESTAGAVPGAAAASDGAESTPGVPSSGSDAIPGATEQPDSRPDNTSDAPTQPADGAESTPGAGPNEPTGRAEALPGASAPPANSDEAAADAASGANAPSDGRPENTSDAAQHANAAQSTPGAGPAGATEAARIDLTETAPGRFSAEWTAPGPGLYVASQGDLRRSFALGPPSPREFRRVIAEEADFAPATAATGGAILRLSDGIPTLRTVAPGRPAHGSALSGNWLGITERGAQTIAGLSRHPVLPPWAWLALIGTLLTLGWLADGRRRG